MTPLESEVIELIATEFGARATKVSLESTLLGDIGVDGDDAFELIESLHRRFDVDFSKFEFQRHFRNEPCIKGYVYFYRKLKYRDEHRAAGKEPVTVAQLVSACERKVWRYDV